MSTVSRGQSAILTRQIRKLSQNVSSQLGTIETNIKQDLDPSLRAENGAVRIKDLLTQTLNESIIKLTSASFASGTYRIRKPGYYRLEEDIVFDPPELNKPLRNYPFPPYQLGFFSAITCECENIIIDLNGKVIRQSKKHALLQRFFAIIELSSQPFNKNMGPSNFGSTITHANNCWIKNGYIGLSSHHGIHSAGTPTNVVIENVSIFDFEVAGIHINGGKDIFIEKVHIGPSRQDVPVLSHFSQAIFSKRAIQSLSPTSRWRHKTPSQVLQDLEDSINETTNAILNDLPSPNALFHNPTGLSDGNVYGIVLHGKGVVVNSLKETINEDRGSNVHISEVCIENLVSMPKTFQSLSLSNVEGESYGSGGRVHSGSVGDVINFKNLVSADGSYVPNVLSEAQFMACKFGMGTAKSSDAVLLWAENGTHNFNDILSEYNFACSRDAMDHVMKGSFGLFLTNLQHVTISNIILCDFENKGEYIEDDCNFRGAHQTGIMINAATKIILNNNVISSLKTLNGDVCGVEITGHCTVSMNNMQTFRLSPHGEKCSMMKVDSRSTVEQGSGHQPMQVTL